MKLITPKRINTLHGFFLTIVVLLFTAGSPVFSQDNSPYSRYGIGDLVPPTNVTNRGLGGISAGYTDFLSINFSNPASYSAFQAVLEAKSKKLVSGRAILDVGLNFDNRTLIETSPARKFTASNALFSYLNVGVPLKNNWGLSFGLRPVSRISYNIVRNERLKDPITGLPIDSATTNYKGDGGSYLASIGTGFSLFQKVTAKGEQKLSIGFNGGYFFGAKDYSTRRSLINDSVDYYQANFETKTNFGGLFFNSGLQYKIPLNNRVSLTIGAYGNWGQKFNATQDILRETFVYDDNQGFLRLDSVSDRRDIKGKIEMPSSYTVGFVAQRPIIMEKDKKKIGWMLGMDFSMQNWSKYRFYGQADSVTNSWQLKMGGQINPIPTRNYFSNVSYRFGFVIGPDYIKVKKTMPQIGASFGLGLPIALSRQAPNQVTLVNLAFEYGKRGNNDNLLKENTFRFSLGFSLSDFWFIKRRYD